MSIQLIKTFTGTAPFYTFTPEFLTHVAATYPGLTHTITDTDSTRTIVEIWDTQANLDAFKADSVVVAEEALHDAYNTAHQVVMLPVVTTTV